MANKRVLLTGISGSIGCHFLAHLMTNTDWEVVGIDSFRHRGWSERVKVMFDAHPDWVERTQIHTHDLTAPFSPILKQRLGRIDYVISMASLSDVEASIQDPIPFVRNNVDLILNLLEYAREIKPEVFVQISTDETLGPTDGKTAGFEEWAPTLPSNPYAASKACQEALAISYWRTYDVPVIITNTMNNVSELQSPSKFPVIIQKAIAKGQEVTIHGSENGDIGSRSYIHSRNFADAVLFILKNLPPYMHKAGQADRPDRYHISGDKQLNNLELAQLIAKLMGKELKYKLINFHKTRSGHDPHYGLNDSKLRSKGWKPPVPFEESLAEVIKWQSEHPEWIN